jgi:hypothetical protein
MLMFVRPEGIEMTAQLDTAAWIRELGSFYGCSVRSST